MGFPTIIEGVVAFILGINAYGYVQVILTST